MAAYQKLKAARANDRPTASAYIRQLFENTLELHGDRKFGDDPAMLGGVGWLGDLPVTYIAIEKGDSTQERIRRNFGCPKPEGYRKALRLMQQAEKFHRPVVCLVDTSGAYCGEDAEQRGQGQAIADNLLQMMRLQTPVISVVIGEGGSGGALGIAVADRVYMLENAVYSVISPEGCASIIWKDAGMVAQAAEHLRITAADMVELGVAERVIPENFEQFDQMCEQLKNQLLSDFAALSALPAEQMLQQRYARFRSIGQYQETENA